MQKIVDFINSKKPTYEALPSLVRLVIKLTAIFLMIFGALLTIPLPEVGIPLLLLSLGVLSFEYTWAEKALNKTVATVAKPSFKRFMLILATVFLAIIAVYFIYLI